MSAVRVLIADDQRLVREGIASLLSIQEGIEVIGVAMDGQEAVDLALAMSPDVVLMDVRMPVKDGITAVAEIRRQLHSCQVLMLTTFDDEEYIVKALRAGAAGYLLKDIPSADLAQAVRLTHAGIYQLSPSVAGKLVGQNLQAIQSQPAKDRPLPRDNDLTERELEVLRWLATGATNREIADALCVSEGTVKNHVSNILGRLGLRDRLQAALFAHEHGLV
ncbi:MAG: response regulator transcription factor [Anaerolineales bacterium]|nr:response regulator transcription factor [Anaerolineales bacterium]